jgi:hypothetical protein
MALTPQDLINRYPIICSTLGAILGNLSAPVGLENYLLNLIADATIQLNEMLVDPYLDKGVELYVADKIVRQNMTSGYLGLAGTGNLGIDKRQVDGEYMIQYSKPGNRFSTAEDNFKTEYSIQLEEYLKRFTITFSVVSAFPQYPSSFYPY